MYPEQGGNCGNCRWYRPLGERQTGDCMLEPPVSVVNVAPSILIRAEVNAQRPVVMTGDYCQHHRSKAPAGTRTKEE